MDHFDEKNEEVFLQRYWYDDKHWNDGDKKGPVFLYICGESTCKPPTPDNSAAMGMGAGWNARLLVLEHRYYGAS